MPESISFQPNRRAYYWRGPADVFSRGLSVGTRLLNTYHSIQPFAKQPNGRFQPRERYMRNTFPEMTEEWEKKTPLWVRQFPPTSGFQSENVAAALWLKGAKDWLLVVSRGDLENSQMYCRISEFMDTDLRPIKTPINSRSNRKVVEVQTFFQRTGSSLPGRTIYLFMELDTRIDDVSPPAPSIDASRIFYTDSNGNNLGVLKSYPYAANVSGSSETIREYPISMVTTSGGIYVLVDLYIYSGGNQTQFQQRIEFHRWLAGPINEGSFFYEQAYLSPRFDVVEEPARPIEICQFLGNDFLRGAVITPFQRFEERLPENGRYSGFLRTENSIKVVNTAQRRLDKILDLPNLEMTYAPNPNEEPDYLVTEPHSICGNAMINIHLFNRSGLGTTPRNGEGTLYVDIQRTSSRPEQGIGEHPDVGIFAYPVLHTAQGQLVIDAERRKQVAYDPGPSQPPQIDGIANRIIWGPGWR